MNGWKEILDASLGGLQSPHHTGIPKFVLEHSGICTMLRTALWALDIQMNGLSPWSWELWGSQPVWRKVSMSRPSEGAISNWCLLEEAGSLTLRMWALVVKHQKVHGQQKLELIALLLFFWNKRRWVEGEGRGAAMKIVTKRDAEQHGSTSVTEPRAVPCAGPCQVLSDSQ